MKNQLPLIRIPLALVLLVATACVGNAQTLYTVVLGNQDHVVGSSTLESGLFASHDLGQSWVQLGPRNLKAYDMDAVISEKGRVLYIAAGNGVHRSLDSGKSWKIITDWKITEVLDIAVDQDAPNNLYVATPFGLWHSDDGGESWERAKGTLRERYIYRVELPPFSYPRRLYVYTDRRQSPSHEFRVSDGRLTPIDSNELQAFSPLHAYDSCVWSNAYGVVGVNPGTRDHQTLTIYADSNQVYRQAYSSPGHLLSCTGPFVRLGPPLPSPVHALIAITDRWPYRLIVGTFGDGLYTFKDDQWVQIGLPGAQVWSVRAYYYPSDD